MPDDPRAALRAALQDFDDFGNDCEHVPACHLAEAVRAYLETPAPACRLIEHGVGWRKWSCGVTATGDLLPLPDRCPFHATAAVGADPQEPT